MTEREFDAIEQHSRFLIDEGIEVCYADHVLQLVVEVRRLREAVGAAWDGGFACSGEGWNAEWPFDRNGGARPEEVERLKTMREENVNALLAGEVTSEVS